MSQQPSGPASGSAPTVSLDHTIVYASDQKRSAEFLAGIFGMEVTQSSPTPPFFHQLVTGNGVTLDFYEWDVETIQPQHYAFVTAPDQFDAMVARLDAAGVPYFTDPAMTVPGIYDDDGMRGTYFDDPDGHDMEIMTPSATDA